MEIPLRFFLGAAELLVGMLNFSVGPRVLRHPWPCITAVAKPRCVTWEASVRFLKVSVKCPLPV